jgi:hypothetical protein
MGFTHPSKIYGYVNRKVRGMSALLSLGERLNAKRGFAQVTTARSLLVLNCQAESLLRPPFCYRHHTPIRIALH